MTNPLSQAASILFHSWQRLAAVKYPDFSVCIQEERQLECDVESAIRGAVKGLKKSSDKEDGWRAGFAQGFVSGNLGSHWSFEYLVKQTPEYAKMITVKALSARLSSSELLEREINQIGAVLHAEDNNLRDQQNKVPCIVEVVNGLFHQQILKCVQEHRRMMIECPSEVLSESELFQAMEYVVNKPAAEK